MWNLQRNFKVISKFFSCQVRILQRARACNWEVSWAITHQNLRREWLKHLWHLTSNSIRETNTSKKAAECPSGRWIARGHHWLHGLYSPWNSPGQNTGVGSHSLSLPNPGIKPRSPTLQMDSLLAEPPGKPNHQLENWKKKKVFASVLLGVESSHKRPLA